jgi:parallel beta-helix repeat protein
VTLSDVTVCGNTEDGVRQTGGSAKIARATVMQNQNKGLSIDNVSQIAVQDATVGSNGDNGVQVLTSAGFSISGSVLYSNNGDGLTVLDSASPSIQNNLVYANASQGIQIAGDTVGSPNAQVLNNTVYANGNRGLLIGGSNAKPPSAGAVVLRNIFQQNGTAGLQINQLSLPGYTGDYNLNFDPYGALTPIGLHDVLSDALFVRPADDDFHLSQYSAGQPVISPAVDAGGIDAAAAGLAGMTTRTDGGTDTGAVDLGYHYRP